MANFEAVLFDWRGTLVVTLPEVEWMRRGLERAGRDASPEQARRVLARIEQAPQLSRLWADGVDSDPVMHRQAYFGVFQDAGLDPDLAAALYEVESDPTHNPFAQDAGAVLRAIKAERVRVAVVSDIHFDIRPAFRRAGLEDLVDVFVLSFEHGVQKPQAEIFQLALKRLGVAPHRALMVGDRAGFDGAAVQLGLVTLLLPPLTGVDDRRLHHVQSLLG